MACPVWGQTLGSGSGYFVFTPSGPLRTKPIRVYYHIPVGNIAAMPVLFSLHGEERDGHLYVNDWVNASDQYGFMVFGPEYPDSLYTGGSGYNENNLFINGDSPSRSTLLTDSNWTSSLLDPLFRSIKQRTGATAADYIAWGHSAGAQMLERFTLYQPGSLARKIIIANAGWYNMADSTQNFPYGTKVTNLTQGGLRQAFAKKLLIMLGQADTDPNSANLRHNSQADAQGLNRLARGRNFCTKSAAMAASLSAAYNWSCVEVPGIAHDDYNMARAAIPYVINAFAGIAAPDEPQPDAFFSGGNLRLAHMSLHENYTLTVYSLLGQQVLNVTGTFGTDSIVPFPHSAQQPFFMVLQVPGHPVRTKTIIALP